MIVRIRKRPSRTRIRVDCRDTPRELDVLSHRVRPQPKIDQRPSKGCPLDVQTAERGIVEEQQIRLTTHRQVTKVSGGTVPDQVPSP